MSAPSKVPFPHQFDSRHLAPGDTFYVDSRHVGGAAKAQALIATAQAQGITHIITDVPDMAGTHYAPHPFALLSGAARQQWPQQPATTVGVTGTNGKTSVAWFYKELCHHLKKSSAALGTLGVVLPQTSLHDWGYTTPDPITLHQNLAALAAQGVTHLAMEISSHALALRRAEAVHLTAAAFTNLTPDHLDFHGTMDDYFAAKQRLFTEVLPVGATAVLPVTTPHSWLLASACKQRGVNVLTYGSANAEVVVTAAHTTINGLDLILKYGAHQSRLTVPLVGTFQVENIAAALGLGLASGLDWLEMIAVLPKLAPVPGRLELCPGPSDGPTAVVDYAHTPDALEKALLATRPFTSGKLIVVFGCGGDRDATKRPLMGAIAARLADQVIITDDNPRTEDAGRIRSAIAAACPGAVTITPREDAIAYALRQGQKGDMVLVAGKGHEDYQIIGKTKYPYRDQTAIAQAFAATVAAN